MNIEGTIKELIRVLVQFNTDIENGNTKGLKIFSDEFLPLLKHYASLESTLKYDESGNYQYFKNEISKVVEYLFHNGNINTVAGDLFGKYYKTTSKTYDDYLFVHGFTRILNPLKSDWENTCDPDYSLNFNENGSNVFRDFVLKYQNQSEPFIGREYLTLIFNAYITNFKNPGELDLWIERFVYPNNKAIDPINIDKEATMVSDRLVLLAILEAIHKIKANLFDYQNFVFHRFGIRSYYKAILTHKEKTKFIRTLDDCGKILSILKK